LEQKEMAKQSEHARFFSGTNMGDLMVRAAHRGLGQMISEHDSANAPTTDAAAPKRGRPATKGTGRRGRPPGSGRKPGRPAKTATGKRRGRPPGSGKKPGRPAKTATGKRRGRPPGTGKRPGRPPGSGSKAKAAPAAKRKTAKAVKLRKVSVKKAAAASATAAS
jgi:hypothetical protein